MYLIANLQIARPTGAEEIYRTDEHFELIEQIEQNIVEANETCANLRRPQQNNKNLVAQKQNESSPAAERYSWPQKVYPTARLI